MSTPRPLPSAPSHDPDEPRPPVCVLLPPRPRRVLVSYVLIAGLLTAFGFGLRYQALFTGFAADDFAQLGMLNGHYLVPRSPLALFTFSDGSPEEVKTLLHGGFYPWWAHPEIRLSMLRPLACALTWLDWKLFGNDPFPYHVDSACWWLFMLGLIAWVFYRLFPVRIALLAYAFYVLDEALGLPLGWIANRNAVISTAFSCIALIAYLRYRDAGQHLALQPGPRAEHAPSPPTSRPPARRDLVFACLAYSIALAGGEYALCTLGYFLAYEWMVARDARALRLRALSAVVAPALVYVALRAALGFGPKHSGVYLDPFAEPVAFLLASLQRFPALYADIVLAVRADWWTFGSPWVHGLVENRVLSRDWLWTMYPWRKVHVAFGIVAMILLALIVRATPRNDDTRNTRWLLAGGAISLAAVIGSFPSSRLLLIALLGFAPLFASYGCAQLSGLRERWSRGRVRTVFSVGAAGVFVLYQLIVPAIHTHDEVTGVANGANAIRRSVLKMHIDQSRLPEQHLIILVTLEGGASLYIPLTRALHGMSVPRTCWTLSLTPSDHVLTRDSDRSFVLSPMSGYTLLTGAPESMLRSFDEAFRPGDTVDVGGMQIK
ncbi:MAG TPA: hypothetical protein VK509_11335, partial [Polyangiales bacterium]|nr:hypothetical protein [Polyangiales bacterium]